MLVYWEHSACGVQAENSDTEEDNEDCEIQKPRLKNAEYEEQIKDLEVKTMLIFDL